MKMHDAAWLNNPVSGFVKSTLPKFLKPSEIKKMKGCAEGFVNNS